MHAFLGCLFILIFGIFLFIIGIFRLLSNWIFGGSMHTNMWNQGKPESNSKTNYNTNSRNNQSQSHSEYTAGNAHHEQKNMNRNNQNGKIFDKSEGEYIDFEEV